MPCLLLPKLDAEQTATLPTRQVLKRLTDGGLWSILANQTTRRMVKAQSELFSIDQQARSYFLVESGELLAYRPGVGRQRAAVRILRDGDLFSFECGEIHAANCVATTDSVVRQIDRRVLNASARTSPLVSSILQAMHAAELAMILETLCGDANEAPDDAPMPLRPNVCRPTVVDGAHMRTLTSEPAAVVRPDFGSSRPWRS
jgi:Cyclic nucleotide-binding domain